MKLQLCLLLLLMFYQCAHAERLTGYSQDEGDGGRGADGKLLVDNDAAADPSIPFGTQYLDLVNGNIYTVHDRGSAIDSRNHLDIFHSHRIVDQGNHPLKLVRWGYKNIHSDDDFNDDEEVTAYNSKRAKEFAVVPIKCKFLVTTKGLRLIAIN